MPARHEDWFSQAERDLQHARHALEAGYYEWACFASQQAAEKAVKALFQRLGAEARGHSVLGLLESLPSDLAVSGQMRDLARALDRHYIGTRYPNAHPEGAPHRYYTREDADVAIRAAEDILRFCAGHFSRPA